MFLEIITALQIIYAIISTYLITSLIVQYISAKHKMKLAKMEIELTNISSSNKSIKQKTTNKTIDILTKPLTPRVTLPRTLAPEILQLTPYFRVLYIYKSV